jgi:ADP-ribose pyrophosphatase YjhB (NUDIX family)
MKNLENFVLRVYGLFINEKKQILITDEFQLGMKMTKFPGGGLHFGEGTVDCLSREIQEECNGQEIENIRHFYTTDFYQKALFYDNHQLISIYYLADFVQPLKFKIATRPFDFEKLENGRQSFRWLDLKTMKQDEFSFPIDKFVCNKLIDKFR